jgi:hypothetical protein
MEDEELETEIIEEEDPVDVELMEIEDPVEYIDLQAEDDEEGEEGETDKGESISLTLSPEEPEISDKQDDEYKEDDATKPVTIEDGQPITFTPVQPGDENVIRMGGRPKPNDKESSKKQTHQSSTQDNEEKDANNKKKGKTATGKTGENDHKPSGQSKNSKNSKSSSGSNSKSKKEKKKDSTPLKISSNEGGKTESEEIGDVDQDLPEEVKNFKPTYLKTVTAKKIFADGRRIPPVELLPQKETNSSVK